MIGDGYTVVRHCENTDPAAELEPDANPIYCEEPMSYKADQHYIVFTRGEHLAVEVPDFLDHNADGHIPTLQAFIARRLSHEYYSVGTPGHALSGDQQDPEIVYKVGGTVQEGLCQGLVWTQLAIARYVAELIFKATRNTYAGHISHLVDDILRFVAETVDIPSHGEEGMCEANGDCCDLQYINAGDTYKDTIVFWEQEFFVCSWGEIVEFCQKDEEPG